MFCLRENPKTNEIHEWNNDESMKYVDGSVDNDLPITRLLEMFNVDHIIAVQVNPCCAHIESVSEQYRWSSRKRFDIQNETSFE